MANSIGGTQGSCVLGGVGPVSGTDLNIFSWQANYRKEVFPDDHYASADNWKRKRGGMVDLAGTFTGRLVEGKLATGTMVMTSHNEVPQTTFELTTYTLTSLDFTGIISNLAYSTAKGGADGLVTGTFESSGAVEETEP